MRSLQHALCSLHTHFFGPHADGRVLTSRGEILGCVVAAGRLGFLVVSVGYVLGRRTCLPDLSAALGCRTWLPEAVAVAEAEAEGYLGATSNPPSEE